MPQERRAVAEDPDHRHHLLDRRARHRRHAALLRLLQQGPHPRQRRSASPGEQPAARAAVPAAAGHRLRHGVLHDPLWMLTFSGKPRNQHVYDHAHESPMPDDGAADRAGGACSVVRRPGAGHVQDADGELPGTARSPCAAGCGAGRLRPRADVAPSRAESHGGASGSWQRTPRRCTSHGPPTTAAWHLRAGLVRRRHRLRRRDLLLRRASTRPRRRQQFRRRCIALLSAQVYFDELY